MPGPATADYDEDDHGVVWLEMMGDDGAAVCEEACRGAGHGGDSGLRGQIFRTIHTLPRIRADGHQHSLNRHGQRSFSSGM